jgi:hypothetical protein
MGMSRRRAIQAISLAVAALKFIPAYTFGKSNPAIMEGPFKSTRESPMVYVIPEIKDLTTIEKLSNLFPGKLRTPAYKSISLPCCG